jgi:putative restriction endonuclease
LTEHPLITSALSGTVRDHSHLPEPRLLDAAHIFMDADEQVGQPVIPNGLPLTKIHNVAFDAHLIGVDPDLRAHVSDRLLDVNCGHRAKSVRAVRTRPDR